MRRPFFALLLLIVALRPAAPDAQTRGRSTPPPAAAARRPAGPAMSDMLVTTLVGLGRSRAVYPEVSRRSGGNGTMMVVQSNRHVIARSSAMSNRAGSSYSPPPELRRDEVTVTCGDIAARHFVHCDQIVVTTPANRAVPPLKTASGPETFHNASGATWVVRRATAVFSAASLKDGFVVTGWSGDKAGFSKESQSWTLVVTAEDAVDFLLLGPSPGQLPN